MPTLKQLTCAVEWAGSNLALEEYQTTYADGYVETYIAVPSTPTPFSVHLKSNGYIAPGLAMFVYMDGVYQCNRNRHNLSIPDENTRRRQTEIDFRVRQKEEMLADGTFQGLQWKFEKVEIVPDTRVEAENMAPHEGEYVGIIEVVILRCCPSDATPGYKTRTSENLKKGKTTLSSSSLSAISQNLSDSDDIGGWFDGAGDPKPKRTPGSMPQLLGLDGSYDTGSQKKTSWDNWDAASSPIVETASDPKKTAWDSFEPPQSPMKNDKANEDNSWDNPQTVDEDSKSTAWDAWDNPPAAASVDKEVAKSRTADPWKIPKPAKEDVKPSSWDDLDKTTAAKEELKPTTADPWKTQGSAKGLAKVESGHAGDTKKPATTKSKIGFWETWGISSSTKEKPIGASKTDSAALGEKPRMGTVEMLNATEGIMHPSSSMKVIEKTKAGGKRDASCDSLHSDWNVAGSERGRSRQPSALNFPTSPAVKIRGGGPGSYTVGSPGGGHTSPAVVINIGTGPPPARDWMAEAKAEREAAKAGKPGSYRASTPPPKNDPWTTNMPVEDYSKEAENHAAGGNWGWGATNNDEKKEGWDHVPGGWEDSNEHPQATDDWGASNDQNNNDDNWNAGNDAQENGDNWGDEKNDTQQNEAWDAGNGGNDKQDDKWSNKNEFFENWDNSKKVDEALGGDKKADANTTWGASDGKEKTGMSNFSFGNSKAQDKPARGSKKERKAAAQAATKAEAEIAKSNKQDTKPATGLPSTTISPKKTALLGAGSPKLKPGPVSITSKKEYSKVTQPNKAHSATGFSFSSPPQPKPYWATWKEGEKEGPIGSPVYTVPSEVAERNKTSHQVRPGTPAAYAHKTATPKYMDTQEDPYAVFVFHYRDKGIIEDMLKTTIEEPEDAEKQRLATLSKDELVAELMKMKEKLGSQGSGSAKSEDKATYKSNPLGVEQPVEWNKLSKKLKNFESSKVTTPEAVNGWLDNTEGEAKVDNTNANENKNDNVTSNDDDKTKPAWNFFGNTKGKGKKGKNKNFDFSNWGNIAAGGDEKKDDRKNEDEKKDDDGAQGGADAWGNFPSVDDWDNDKKTEVKPDDGKKDSGNANISW